MPEAGYGKRRAARRMERQGGFGSGKIKYREIDCQGQRKALPGGAVESGLAQGAYS